MKKPNAIIIDFVGPITSSTYHEQVLIPYVNTYFKEYLQECWGDLDLMPALKILREHVIRSQKEGLSFN